MCAFPVEVGCRGVPEQSVWTTLSSLDIPGSRKTTQSCSESAPTSCRKSIQLVMVEKRPGVLETIQWGVVILWSLLICRTERYETLEMELSRKILNAGIFVSDLGPLHSYSFKCTLFKSDLNLVSYRKRWDIVPDHIHIYLIWCLKCKNKYC
mgnify:FL=1